MCQHLAGWLCGYLEDLRDAQPDLPDALSDRQQDSCEPLLAIADLAGGNWPERARKALVSILNGDMAAEDSIGVRLLWDIRAVFDQKRAGRLTTARLIDALCKTNPQWDEFNYGKPLSPAALARLLRRYGILVERAKAGDADAAKLIFRHIILPLKSGAGVPKKGQTTESVKRAFEMLGAVRAERAKGKAEA